MAVARQWDLVVVLRISRQAGRWQWIQIQQRLRLRADRHIARVLSSRGRIEDRQPGKVPRPLGCGRHQGRLRRNSAVLRTAVLNVEVGPARHQMRDIQRPAKGRSHCDFIVRRDRRVQPGQRVWLGIQCRVVQHQTQSAVVQRPSAIAAVAECLRHRVLRRGRVVHASIDQQPIVGLLRSCILLGSRHRGRRGRTSLLRRCRRALLLGRRCRARRSRACARGCPRFRF